MSTDYSNNDDLEEFYKRKFNHYTIEPLPYAFDRINTSLGTAQSPYSKLKNLFVDKYKATLFLSVMLNLTLIFWIWNLHGEQLTLHKKIHVNEIKKDKLNATGQEATSVPKEILPKSSEINPYFEIPLEKKKDRPKPSRTNTPIEKESVNVSQNNDIPLDSIPSSDSIQVKEPVNKVPQDFKNNLEKYSQHNSDKLKDSARQLFLPTK
ncbi:MAG TPA: hypothetical protein VF691_10585 [Cytophagaceae bacterium]|jgi:hypothetical protein